MIEFLQGVRRDKYIDKNQHALNIAWGTPYTLHCWTGGEASQCKDNFIIAPAHMFLLNMQWQRNRLRSSQPLL